MGILFLLGTLTGLEKSFYPLIGALVLLIISISRFRHLKKKRAIIVTMVLTCVFVMAILKANHKDVVYISQKEYLENKVELEVSGRIYKKEFKNEKIRLYLKDVRSKDGVLFPVLIFGGVDVEIGSVISVSGKIMEISAPDNDGEFDYGKYLKSQKIVGNIEAKEIVVLREPKVSFFEYLFDLREKIKDFYSKNLPGEEGGLLSSITLGDKTELDKEASDLFRKAGLSHILAISGLHLSIIGNLIYEFLRRRGVGFLGAGIVSSIIVLLYGLFAGTPISMVRALSMFLIVLVGNVLGRAADMLNSLSIVALGFLIYNPFIIYNTGFALSFLIILGICLVSSPMSDYYRRLCKERWNKKYKDEDLDFEMTYGERIVSSAISGFSIWAFSVPILAVYFNEVPVYVIVLNLLVLPVLGVLLVLGLVSGFLGIAVLLVPCHYILYYYEVLADFFVKLPGSTLVIARPGVWSLVWYYGILLLMVYVITCDFSFISNGRMEKFGIKKVCYKNSVKFLLFVSIPLFLTATLKITSFQSGFRIDMLSVGQGDGIYIQSKENISFFVDGGSTSEKNIGEYTILPYLKYSGVSHIDYWVLTHLDDDHVNGFMEIMEKGYRVDNLILAKSVEKGEALNSVLNLCKRNHTKVNYVIPGDYVETKSLRIDFLYPDYPSKREGANENSLVFLLSYGNYNGLFTGDMGIAEEEDLMESQYFKNLIKDADIELLKVAHHGSKNSSKSEWLAYLSPDLAIISAGKNNRYHHPSPETIERLNATKIPYLTTIDTGQIRIKPDRGTEILSGFHDRGT